MCPDVPAVVEQLASIVDARLVRPIESRVEVRFVVLGTVRAFAREQLLAHPDLVRRRELLAAHLTSRVGRRRPGSTAPMPSSPSPASTTTRPTSASAIDWALDAGRRGVAVELTLASLDCWISAGRHNEALVRTRAVLDHVPQQGPEAAQLHAAVALLAYHLTDFDQVQEHSRLALDLAERHDDRRSAAVARTFLGATLVFRGEIAEGLALAEARAGGGRGAGPVPALGPGPAGAGDRRWHARRPRRRASGPRGAARGGPGPGRPVAHRRHPEHPGRARARRGRRRDRPRLRGRGAGDRGPAAADGEPGRGPDPGARGPRPRRPRGGRRPTGHVPGAQRPAGPDLRRGPEPAGRRVPGGGPRRRRLRRPALRGRPRALPVAGSVGPAPRAGPRRRAGRGSARARREGRPARLDDRQRPPAPGGARAAGGGARRRRPSTPRAEQEPRQAPRVRALVACARSLVHSAPNRSRPEESAAHSRASGVASRGAKPSSTSGRIGTAPLFSSRK